MTLQLVSLDHVLAFLGCAGLLLLWVVKSRRFAGFYWLAVGWVTIIWACLSVGPTDSVAVSLGILGGIGLAMGLISCSLWLMAAALKVRGRRTPIYRPNAAQLAANEKARERQTYREAQIRVEAQARAETADLWDLEPVIRGTRTPVAKRALAQRARHS